MSLQNKRKQLSLTKTNSGKRVKRANSVQSKEKISFRREEKQKFELSVDDILQKTIKSANQAIIIQTTAINRQSFQAQTQNLSGSRKVLAPQEQQKAQGKQKQKEKQKEKQKDKQKDKQKQKDISTKYQHHYWQKIKIQQKRKIKGIKSKIKWNNNPSASKLGSPSSTQKANIFIIIRVIITDNYTRLNQPDFFVQLDSANVELSREEQKSIQRYINDIVQQEQNKIDQYKNQIFYWLRNLLISVHICVELLYENKNQLKTQIQSKTQVLVVSYVQCFINQQILQFKRNSINENYILYPNPASITWSPHGILCVSQTKISTISRPIVGNIFSYRNILEGPYKFQRFTRKLNENDDLKMVDQNENQYNKNQENQLTTEAQFFGWDAKQQINFSVFGKTADDQHLQLQHNNTASLLSSQQLQSQKVQKKITKDFEIFKGSIPPKIQKIYRRYFHSHVQNIRFQFLEKLKIYAVKSENVELEDGILYLIDKIQRYNRVGVMQLLIQNQFTGYNGAFTKLEKDRQLNRSQVQLQPHFPTHSLTNIHKANNQYTNSHSYSHSHSQSQSEYQSKIPKFQRYKYQLISQFLQQKIRSSPQCQQFLYLKCILIENQFFRLALENYFQENFKKLRAHQFHKYSNPNLNKDIDINMKYQSLGTYDNFDDANAEKLLFRLIEQLLVTEKINKQASIRIKNKYKAKPEKYDDPQYKIKKYKRIEQSNEQMRLFLKGYVKVNRAEKYLPELLEVQSGFRKVSIQGSSQQQDGTGNIAKQRQIYKERSIQFLQNTKTQGKKVSTRNINLNTLPFLVLNKIQFEPFQFNMILNQNQRKNFIETIVPILWIKDRSMQKFQYKIAKRVIIANSKILNFLQKLASIAQLWKKADKIRRNTFLKNVVKEYKKHQQSIQDKMVIGKKYIAYCQLCMGEFQAYNIQQLLRVTRCQRCKFY